MNKIEQFQLENLLRIEGYKDNIPLKKAAIDFVIESNKAQYSYHFSWLGRPIIQYPQDMIAMQEIIYNLKPDLIIETGIAHGGSLIYYASLCELIGNGQVLGIDIDIRKHNKEEIENHPMYKRIRMIQGSSIDPEIVMKVKEYANNFDKILVLLDSNHTHEHVLSELLAYSELVSVNSYIVVFDTVVSDLPDGYLPNRAWSKEKNPKSAVIEFMETNENFIIDYFIDEKLLISVAPSGYLKRVK
ncbi:MAG TPA: cephalosporin hydroxylase family protein [Saprospiraceae bacterium]|nr:cephalosporin hydroxylase family protein [Saprospiraceae bacterium]